MIIVDPIIKGLLCNSHSDIDYTFPLVITQYGNNLFLKKPYYPYSTEEASLETTATLNTFYKNATILLLSISTTRYKAFL